MYWVYLTESNYGVVVVTDWNINCVIVQAKNTNTNQTVACILTVFHFFTFSSSQAALNINSPQYKKYIKINKSKV